MPSRLPQAIAINASLVAARFFYTSKHICPFAITPRARIARSSCRNIAICHRICSGGLAGRCSRVVDSKRVLDSHRQGDGFEYEPCRVKDFALGNVPVRGCPSALCTVELAKDGLWIEPSAGTQVSLQRASDDKVVRLCVGSGSSQTVVQECLLAPPRCAVEEEHVVWRFNW